MTKATQFRNRSLFYTDKIEAGAILAKSILNERGQVLLHDGIVLTERMLARLIELGISVIYIKIHENEVSELDIAFSELLLNSDWIKVSNRVYRSAML